MTARSRNVLFGLIALAAILPFLPALTAPFLQWDDAANLVENAHWRGFTAANIRWMLTTMHGGPYQPLSWLSYAFDFTLWGANPAAMRATNYLLHAASAVLLFLVAEELFREASPAASARERLAASAFAALVWAVHPLRVESVVWLTERRDVLSGVFYLLAVLLYLRKPDKPLRPLFVYCLAVLAKASVITLPLTLILLDRWPLRRRSWADKLPYLAISLAGGLAGLAGQAAYGTLKDGSVGIGARLALGLHSLWWYAAKTVWPSGLSPYHRVPAGFGFASPAAWGPALGLAALVAAAWAARRRAPAAPAALTHYALALLPMAGFVRFGHHLVAERYSYLPAMSLSLLAGAALAAARRRPALRGPASAASTVVLLAFAALSGRGARYWSADERLWNRALAVDAQTTLARVNLASLARREGRVEEALAQERIAVSEDPRLGEQWNNLGADAVAKGNWPEAETLLRSALAAKPGLATAHYNLAAALSAQGRRDEALLELEEAARLDAVDAKIQNNLGVALTGAGRLKEAEAALRRAAELDPRWAAPSYNRGNVLNSLGRPDEALAAFENAARLDPGMTMAWINAGTALARQGRLAEAEARLREALKTAPGDAVARYNLEQIRKARGR